MRLNEMAKIVDESLIKDVLSMNEKNKRRMHKKWKEIIQWPDV